jgi:hypothetical protein
VVTVTNSPGRTAPIDPTAVFLNCPFDEEYEPLLNAIVLTVVFCGFVPRIANETNTVSSPRIEQICATLHGSWLSIHDLSRCEGEGDQNLARFNMPLELGIAMGHRFATQSAGASLSHDWFVLVPDGHSHTQFISNLAGFDPGVHEGTPKSLIPEIMKWLLTRNGDEPSSVGFEPADVIGNLPRFNAAMEQRRINWLNVEPPWSVRLAEARQIVASL